MISSFRHQGHEGDGGCIITVAAATLIAIIASVDYEMCGWSPFGTSLLHQARIDSDTPSLAAITLVAPGVRFSAFAILVTPDLALAIAFIVLISSFVHARRTTFFAFAILTPFHAIASGAQMHEHCCKNMEAGGYVRKNKYQTAAMPMNAMMRLNDYYDSMDGPRSA